MRKKSPRSPGGQAAPIALPLRLMTATVAGLVLQGAHGEGKPVFSLYEDVPPGDPSPDIWLSTTVTIPPATASVTICFHANFRYAYSTSNMVMELQNNMKIWAYEDKMTMIETAITFRMLEDSIAFREWVHYCVTAGEGHQITVNGQSQPLISEMAAPVTLHSGELELWVGLKGNESTDGAFSTFGMSLGLPSVFSRLPTLEEIEDLYLCRAVPDGDLVVNPWTAYGYRAEPPLNFKETLRLEEVDPEVNSSNSDQDDNQFGSRGNSQLPAGLKILDVDYCPPTPTFFYVAMITGSYSAKKSEKLCSLIKGTLPSDTDLDLEQSVSKFMIPKFRYIGFWLSSSSSFCTMMVFGVDMPATQTIKPCNQDIGLQTICKVPVSANLKVLGGNIPDTLRKLYVDRCGIGPCFYTRDLSKISISEDGTKYEFRNGRGDLSFSSYLPDHNSDRILPVGRLVWQGPKNDTVTITISPCNENEFTCDSGNCIPLEKHCDGIPDCENYSDEQCVTNFPLSDSYDDGRASDVNLTINASVTIDSIPLIDVDNGRVTILMILESRWRDGRMEFVQLQNDYKRNRVAEKTWYPRFTLNTVLFEDELEYIKGENVLAGLFAERVELGNTTVQDGREKRRYTGHLLRVEKFAMNFVCRLELNLYPFGVHVCVVNVSLLDTGITAAYFNEEGVSVHFKGQRLALFESNQVRFTLHPIDSPRPHTISIALLLESLFGGYILTTFMPCFVIGTIGTITLTFAYHIFSERIMVTLSCLIVEAGLYSQINTTMPASASPKAIDIYFFFFILRLFLVCIHHAVVHRWLLALERCSSSPSSSSVPKEEETGGKRPKNSLGLGKAEKGNEYKDWVASLANKPGGDNLSPLRVPPAPAYYSPHEAQVLMNSWMATERSQKKAIDQRKIFKTYNELVFVIFCIIDLVFMSGYLIWIISSRNKILRDFSFISPDE